MKLNNSPAHKAKLTRRDNVPGLLCPCGKWTALDPYCYAHMHIPLVRNCECGRKIELLNMKARVLSMTSHGNTYVPLAARPKCSGCGQATTMSQDNAPRVCSKWGCPQRTDTDTAWGMTVPRVSGRTPTSTSDGDQ